MPVRSIPLSHRSLTGVLSSPKILGAGSFESSLERDLLMLLVFDTKVFRIEVQPRCIHWQDLKKNSHSYTPDLLVHYIPSGSSLNKPRIILYEVKYRQDLKENWAIYKPKFKATIKYAKERNWHFFILTEREIRTPYLDNVKFLLPYKKRRITDPRFDIIIKLLNQHGQMPVKEIITFIDSTFSGRAELLSLIWAMLAQYFLQTNLTLSLNQNSIVWVTQ